MKYWVVLWDRVWQQEAIIWFVAGDASAAQRARIHRIYDGLGCDVIDLWEALAC